MNKQAALEAAKTLLSVTKNNNERNDIQRPLCELIQAILPQTKVIIEAPVGQKRTDIYVPQRRFVAETKTPKSKEAYDHKLKETRDQIAGYITKFRDTQLEKPPIPGLNTNQDWIELITDGRIFRIRKWPHQKDSQPGKETLLLPMIKPEQLVTEMEKLLGTQDSALPWVPDDPKDLIKLYESSFKNLQEIQEKILKRPYAQQVKTAKGLWLQTLKATGMPPESGPIRNTLFILHCHLLHVAEAIIKETTGTSPTHQHEGFHTWVNDTTEGQKYLNSITQETKKYEWRHRSNDILRDLYMGMIEKTDKKGFGKYYTPDWLARWLTTQILDDKWIQEAVNAVKMRDPKHLHGIGILDPTCGSGTFLLAAIDHITEHQFAKNKKITMEQAARLVHGIDADPIAVALAKANLARKLGTTNSANIQIYLGDSLIADKIIKDDMKIRQKWTFRSRKPKNTKGTPVSLPVKFIDDPSFTSKIHTLVDCANPDKELTWENSPELKEGLDKEETQELFNAHETLTKIIIKEGNSVWAWYAIQAAGIDRLQRVKINRILANPPWVRMDEVTHKQRRKTMERLAGKPNNPAGSLKIWNGGAGLSASFDIAQIFIKRSISLYTTAETKAGFLVLNSAIKANHWKKLRETEGKKWKQIIDLAKVKEKPLPRDACAIIIDATNQEQTTIKEMSSSKKPIQIKEPWISAQEKIQIHDSKEKQEESSSKYQPKRGAQIAPHVLTIVDKTTVHKTKNQITFTTRQSTRAKGIWKKLQPVNLQLPQEWITHLLKSEAILPFTTHDIQEAIIPINATKTDLAQEPYPQGFQKISDIYKKHHSKGTPENLIEYMNYFEALESQLKSLNKKAKIAYPKSGNLMKATIVPKNTICDQKTYIVETCRYNEAYYLLAILNAPALTKAFQNAKDSGMHFDRTPFTKIPIPPYDPNNQDHKQLAQLSKQAQTAAELERNNILANTQKIPGPNKFPDIIREHLKIIGISGQIDKIAKKLLPGYTS